MRVGVGQGPALSVNLVGVSFHGLLQKPPLAQGGPSDSEWQTADPLPTTPLSLLPPAALSLADPTELSLPA